MKHFKKPDDSLHAFDEDYEGGLITEDMRPISEADVALLLTPKPSDLKDAALVRTRLQRQPILGVLDGMQSSALTKSDTTKAAVIETAKQGLKDLTKIDLSTCVTADDFKAAIMTRYREIAAALPVDVRIAFGEALQ